MAREATEDYLGAIYRLRSGRETPVPLSAIQVRLHLSAMTVHEMVQRLVVQGLVIYHPYQGVTLTEAGETLALALIRRHRLWERFLTDWLGVAWDEAHEIAGRLEHAAPESVTERLAQFMGDPEHCPHGGPIPPHAETQPLLRLSEATAGQTLELVHIEPETAPILRVLEAANLRPGTVLTVLHIHADGVRVRCHEQELHLAPEVARALHVTPVG